VAGLFGNEQPSNAPSLFDPAMYGDQELRVGTVEVLAKASAAPFSRTKLAPSFYQLALDGLFDAKTNMYGPDSAKIVLEQQRWITRKSAGSRVCLGGGGKGTQNETAVTIADAVAIGGGSVRIDRWTRPDGTVGTSRCGSVFRNTSPIDLLFSGNRRPKWQPRFKQIEEMTALLAVNASKRCKRSARRRIERTGASQVS
jgi:hypothetical protein